MANVIGFSASLSLNIGGITEQASVTVSGQLQAGANGAFQTQALSTTTSQISICPVSTIGYLFVKNLDATHSVRIGIVSPVTSGNAFVTLQPG